MAAAGPGSQVQTETFGWNKPLSRGGIMPGTLKQASIPETTVSAMQLAVAGARLLDTGYPEEAEQTWREAVRLDPGCNTAWSCLTDLLARTKRACPRRQSAWTDW